MIGFRVDANENIATGHLMRCMSICIQCMKLGEPCIFFLAEDKETKRLRDKKIAYRILHTQWNHMEDELPILKQLIAEEELDWLVVDSYQATPEYLEELNKMVKVMYLDDMAKEAYPVSAVLHYSQWPGEASYEAVYQSLPTVVLSGMQYVPLREEFFRVTAANAGTQPETKRRKSILITTGGTDTYNVSGQLLTACLHDYMTEFQDYEFEVIVGNMNSHEPSLRQMEEADSRIHLHKNVQNMSEYMRSCEMAVSAGGTTLFELCACKIPTVCFSFADNQQGFTEEMGKHEIMLCAGDAREHSEIGKVIAARLMDFMKQPPLKEQYTKRMEKLVDGMGSMRIAKYLCEKR